MPTSRIWHQVVFAVVVAAAVALTAGASWAGTLGSAVLLSTDAERLDCFLSNIGHNTITITNVSVMNGGFTILVLSFNTCDVLGAGANCAFSADLDARFSARGVVEFQGNGQGLRGQCQLTSAANHIIATTDLR